MLRSWSLRALVATLLAGSSLVTDSVAEASPEPERSRVALVGPGGQQLVFATHNAFRPVSRTWSLPADGVTELAVVGSDGSAHLIGTTPDHPFWSVLEEEWLPAVDLPPDALLSRADGGVAVLAWSGYRETPRIVYNLSVPGPRNYYVRARAPGSPTILAHNIWDCDVVKHNVATLRQKLAGKQHLVMRVDMGRPTLRLRVDNAGKIIEVSPRLSLSDPDVVTVSFHTLRRGRDMTLQPARVHFRSSSGYSDAAKAAVEEAVKRAFAR